MDLHLGGQKAYFLEGLGGQKAYFLEGLGGQKEV
jgi:hypothetical protein